MTFKLNVLENGIAFHKLFALKKRYFYTRSNKLRARYAVSALCFACFTLSFSYQVLNAPDKGSLQVASVERGAVSMQEIKTFAELEDPDAGMGTPELTVYSRVLPNNIVDLIKREDKKDPKDDGVRELKIKSGQTVAGVLQTAGVTGDEAHKIVKALGEHIDLRKVKAGQTIKARFEDILVPVIAEQSEENASIDIADITEDAANIEPSAGDQAMESQKSLTEISMVIDPIKSVTVQRNGDGYTAEIKEKEVIKRTYAGTTEIQTSLYGSAARSGIPSQIIGKMIRMYSFSVDFQRDIRREDKIELLYDVYETEDGEAVRYGDILYANLSVSGKNIPLYRFENSEERSGYYDQNGKSIKKTLMRTPIDGGRMSSGFGMRKHPVLGYNKMHKGVDFAAPIGTPIYAAGDGVLEEVGRKGGYGNYIRVRHSGNLKTAYAHMHKFAKGMSKGKRVSQGDVIGYVGTTGRSTGPHLHFEVLMNGKQVNPNRVDLPMGDALKGKDLENFKAMIKKYNEQYVELLKSMKFAFLNSEKPQARKVAG
jgi:murein DD-endopeptidase MepM/ murein hydrolase activator NlpD